ncbi:aspartoacylase [Echinimonas agarilytica]|uniref:Aspartoacylase n=1 Tax=Echinimonas agarilytica TaxID=1215918 RepID=A0AA41W3S0_9GAMM|nr:aspartoacylase [Echinimonas agarilytica]MCM2678155.1 aspartoacylase [Echinimonas agarilytica]
MTQFKSVAIVGGTHGNEFTGIYLLKKWQQQIAEVSRPSFNTELVFANPRAHAENKRYCDQDLNRQFSEADLANPTLTGYEQSRAKAINQQLGPKGDARIDFIIDLHTTTSNMGATLLLLQQGEVYNKLAAYVQQQMPEVIVIRDDDHLAQADHRLLATLGKFGVIVEVGPVPQSVLRADVYQQSEQMTQHILDFLELWNKQQLPSLPSDIDAYRYTESLTLPLDDQGNRLGMVHPHVQDSDFNALEPGAPLFQCFDGTVMTYQGESIVYPGFVNEAAYYDNNLALSLHEKVTIKVSE